MKYMMKYLDASRHVMMKEIIESEGDAAYTLQQSCEKAARRHEQLKLRLSEKDSRRQPEPVPGRNQRKRGDGLQHGRRRKNRGRDPRLHACWHTVS